MKSAQKGYENLVGQIRSLGDKKGKINQEFKNKFIEKISNDFNIPQGLVIAHEVLKSELTNPEKLATILDFDKVLGLKLDSIKKEKIIIPEKIKKLVQQREKTRKDKDFNQADKIRKEIEKEGFNIKDTNKEQIISPKY